MLDVHKHQRQDATQRPTSESAISHLRRAWWCLAATPLAFIAAVVVGNGLLSILGDDPDSETSVPLGHGLLAGIPATLLLIAPTGIAVILGRRAIDEGEARGKVPAVIGCAGCAVCDRDLRAGFDRLIAINRLCDPTVWEGG